MKEYLEFATDRQREILNSIESEGSQAKAAKKLGVSRGTISNTVTRVKSKAAKFNVRENSSDMPDGFFADRYRLNSDGDYYPSVIKPIDNKYEFILELKEELKTFPKVKLVKPPKQTLSDLLNLYTLTDVHLGMLCWAAESGDNYSLDEASDLLIKSFNEQISDSKPAHTAFINQLGDFIHTNGLVPETPRGRNVLDCDSRYYKIVKTGYKLMRRIIDLALQKHQQVVVLCADANHDPSTVPLFQVGLEGQYENEPRVEILQSASTYYAYQWGDVMTGFHHGHKMRKPSELKDLFSSDPAFRQMWGDSKFCYIHTGHLHHYTVSHIRGGKCIQHPSICGRNAYESRHGYVSERACISHTYHKKFGERGSNIIVPEMFI